MNIFYPNLVSKQPNFNISFTVNRPTCVKSLLICETIRMEGETIRMEGETITTVNLEDEQQDTFSLFLLT